MSRQLNAGKRFATRALAMCALAVALATTGSAHPLGNFTVNHFSRLEVGLDTISVRYVVDMAEISAFQELQRADLDGDGATSDSELRAHTEGLLSRHVAGLVVMVDGVRLPLTLRDSAVSLPPGSGGLSTLRIEATFDAPFAASSASRRIRYEDRNDEERTGWHEIVVVPGLGASVFDCSAFGTSLTDELRSYPEDSFAAPLAERTAEFSAVAGAIPEGASPLRARDGNPTAASTDRLASLIAVKDLTPGVALLGLLVAAALGGLHAMSPGHGKTVVGAYLVGSRGTWKHAAFLGLTVTITHTAGVFALGLVTLFASAYVVPERLFPVLSFVSGAIVVGIGSSLFVRRLSAALKGGGHDDGHHHHHGHHHHDHGHDHHDHAHAHGYVHSHGGHTHSHVPPGANGERVTWRSLLALGVSGGLLPCPSALVVLLSAIALGRVAYGMLLIVAFSAGLAAVLTAVGLLFVYARGLLKAPTSSSRIVRLLPAASSLVIALVGLGICYEALISVGIVTAFASTASLPAPAVDGPSIASLGALGLLALGLVFGVKHASEADHVIAVSTIVAEQRSVMRAALVGGLWGVGHTASLVVVGFVVLLLRVAIPEAVASWLEFGVAVMIVALGIAAVRRALRVRDDVHLHAHSHGSGEHEHLHFHDGAPHGADHQHHVVRRIGLKPIVVGAVHGLAGSAALTLLVVSQIESPIVGLLYLLVFGLGSVAGMLAMSGLVGLPFAIAAHRVSGYHRPLQIGAGALSVLFGLWYAAHSTGIV